MSEKVIGDLSDYLEVDLDTVFERKVKGRERPRKLKAINKSYVVSVKMRRSDIKILERLCKKTNLHMGCVLRALIRNGINYIPSGHITESQLICSFMEDGSL